MKPLPNAWSGRSFAALAVMALVSAALHGAAFAAAARLPVDPPVSRAMELEVDVTEAPPPPAPAKPAPPPPPTTPPKAAPRLAYARNLPPPPPRGAPPPPNEELPRQASPSPGPIIPRVGVSLSSTSTGGSFAVGVGNTLYGKSRETAVDPAVVKPYRAEHYAAPTQLSAQPRVLETPEIPYPAEARAAGIEGKVVLLLRIDPEGRVVDTRVVSEPGSGLGAAARAGALRFRFSPGLENGEAVGTEIRFTYTFILE